MLKNTWRGLTPGVATSQDVIKALGPPGREVQGATYGSLEGLQLLTYDDIVASIFLKGDRVLLIITHPRGGYPDAVSAWEGALGKPEARLPSVNGKSARVNVYSDKGLAAISDGNNVILVEVFVPMTLDEYTRHLYRKPPVFRK